MALPTRVREIVLAVAQEYEVEPGQILEAGCRGADRIVEARHEAILRVRELTKPSGSPVFSSPIIGQYFGGRDHSTILNAVKRAKERRAEREAFLAEG